MGEAFIPRKINANSENSSFAVIAVTYPEGSTCTCTNEITTLTAPSTSGQVIFNITSTGNWTVTITDGTNIKSQTVEITEEGQFESVVLGYIYYIFKSGEGAKVELSTSLEDTSTNYVNVGTDKIDKGWTAHNRTSAFSTVGKIDLTNYSTLGIEYTCSNIGTGISTNSWYEAFGVSAKEVSTGTTEGNLTVARKAFTSSTTKKTDTLDISSLTDEYYIGVCGAGISTTYNLWLI